MGASLVVQRLRIHLPMQGTWVWSPVQEEPTGPGVMKPMCHTYWACALEPLSPSYWDHKPQPRKPVHPRARAPQQEKPPQWEARAPQLESSPQSLKLEKACAQPWRPSTTINRVSMSKIIFLSTKNNMQIILNSPLVIHHKYSIQESRFYLWTWSRTLIPQYLSAFIQPFLLSPNISVCLLRPFSVLSSTFVLLFVHRDGM